MASSHMLASPALLMGAVGCDNQRCEAPGAQPYRRLLWSSAKNHLSASPARRAPSTRLGCPDLQDLMRRDRRLQRAVAAQSQGTAQAVGGPISSLPLPLPSQDLATTPELCFFSRARVPGRVDHARGEGGADGIGAARGAGAGEGGVSECKNS
ncbi:hypothetical protein B0H14DRAFT_2581395 [Mycena olivaceomarginata]|nr:hypothetical protein B0H14DRAFT_2581395 [Mycena olivaceomarginata]